MIKYEKKKTQTNKSQGLPGDRKARGGHHSLSCQSNSAQGPGGPAPGPTLRKASSGLRRLCTRFQTTGGSPSRLLSSPWCLGALDTVARQKSTTVSLRSPGEALCGQASRHGHPGPRGQSEHTPHAPQTGMTGTWR